MKTDITTPPEPVPGTDGQRGLMTRREAEKSLVREAIAGAVEGGALKLAARLEEVYEANGPKAYVEVFLKVLEFTEGKKHRVVTGSGDAPVGPVININFGHGAAPVQIVADETTPIDVPWEEN
jgi:hypothetical protein